MNTIVSSRFKLCHDHLLERKIEKSSSAIAESLMVKKQSVSAIINGKRDVTVEMLRLLCEIYGVNPSFLLLGEGEIFLNKKPSKNNIRLVPIKARAGYASQCNDSVFISELNHFSLPDPRFEDGEFLCFEVEGESMEPNYFDGDYVICRQENIVYLSQRLKTNEVYVVVTNTDVLLKRVINNTDKDKTILLKSDNTFYSTITLKQSEIKELWKVESRLTRKKMQPL